MRNWIEGKHFPDQLKIEILDNPKFELDQNIKQILRNVFSNCEWNTESIANSISEAIKENEIPARDCYRNLYLAILGKEKGPKLAPILSELSREKVLSLLH